jgi:hypothetical protein
MLVFLPSGIYGPGCYEHLICSKVSRPLQPSREKQDGGFLHNGEPDFISPLRLAPEQTLACQAPSLCITSCQLKAQCQGVDADLQAPKGHVLKLSMAETVTRGTLGSEGEVEQPCPSGKDLPSALSVNEPRLCPPLSSESGGLSSPGDKRQAPPRLPPDPCPQTMLTSGILFG